MNYVIDHFVTITYIGHFVVSRLFIIIIIIIIYSLNFFTSANADGLSLEIEWQQVSSSVQDYSQYSSRSQ